MARYIKSFANDAAIQAAVDDKTLGKPYVALNEQTGLIDWNSYATDYSKKYLTIEALEDGNFNIKAAGLYYSVNGGSWVQGVNLGNNISLTKGDKVRFKGESLSNIRATGNTISFIVYGNIMSLGYGDNFENQYLLWKNLEYLFSGCTNLMDVSNLVLPATGSSGDVTNVYRGMFIGCSKIETSPVLPAYPSTFGYTALMFSGCTSLNKITCLKAYNGSGYMNSFSSWVKGVSPTGTFVKAAGVSWESGQSGIPSGWTVIEE